MSLETPPSEDPVGAHSSASESNADWTERQLPPVKPPTAGFLVQLFVIPMMIVGVIVTVWFLFGWLAQSGAKPEELAADLERLNAGSWQRALSLSQMLRDPGNDELRVDDALAQRLADTLTSQLDQPTSASDEIRLLKIWLCQALGQFDIATGLPALVQAASPPQDVQVRRAAVQGIGLLANHATPASLLSDPDLLAVLRDNATETSELPDDEVAYGQLRHTTAFTLGILGGPEALDALAGLLGDAYPDARYNAATGLARHGDERAVPRLCEMLRLDNQDAVKFEEDGEKEWKQNLVIINGLRAIRQLYEVNPTAPDASLVAALQELKDQSDRLPISVIVELDATWSQLNDRRN